MPPIGSDLGSRMAQLFQVLNTPDSKRSNPRVFGSALHGNDREVSDLDLLARIKTQIRYDQTQYGYLFHFY
jgi:predicted nucleotidyltransferase